MVKSSLGGSPHHSSERQIGPISPLAVTTHSRPRWEDEDSSEITDNYKLLSHIVPSSRCATGLHSAQCTQVDQLSNLQTRYVRMG